MIKICVYKSALDYLLDTQHDCSSLFFPPVLLWRRFFLSGCVWCCKGSDLDPQSHTDFTMMCNCVFVVYQGTAAVILSVWGR